MFAFLSVGMLVPFRLVTGMNMLVGTVRAGMFVRMTGLASFVLVLVRMAMSMLMTMNVLMFMCMNQISMNVLVYMAVPVLMPMFMFVLVRSFHIRVLLCDTHFFLRWGLPFRY